MSRIRMIYAVDGRVYTGPRVLQQLRGRYKPKPPAAVQKRPAWQQCVWIFEKMRETVIGPGALFVFKEPRGCKTRESEYQMTLKKLGKWKEETKTLPTRRTRITWEVRPTVTIPPPAPTVTQVELDELFPEDPVGPYDHNMDEED